MAQPLRFFALPLCLGITSAALPGCSSDEGGGSKGSGDGGAGAGTGTGGAGSSTGGRGAGGSTTGGAGAGTGGAQGGSGGTGSAGDGGGATGGAAPEGGIEGGTGGTGGTEGGTEGGDASPPPRPTAFRMTELVLLDPVPQAEGQSSCTSLLDAINGLISSSFDSDAPVGDAGGDGELDLSFVMVHRPLLQSGSGNATFYQAACASPAAGTTCSPKASLPGLGYTVTNEAAGTCLAADPSDVTPGNGPILPATAGADGCIVSSTETFALALGPVTLTFDSARIGAQWVGDPATGMIDGIFIGFLSQERLNQIFLPPDLGSVALSTVFPTGSAAVTCVDEIDVGPDGTTPGWWWHLNFRAEAVGWSE